MTDTNRPYHRQAAQRLRRRAYKHYLRVNLEAGTPVECEITLPGCLHHATQVDHIVPVDAGGHFTEDNLQPACQPCNARRGNLYQQRKYNQHSSIKRDW